MYQKQVIQAISGAVNLPESQIHLEKPIFAVHGDYSSNIALQLKTDPKIIVNKLNKDKDLEKIIAKITIADPGFINFYLNNDALINVLKHIINSGENFGRSELFDNQKWLLEHTSPNPNKAMHLGHLRNNVVAMAIGRLWENVGVRVIYDAVDNNRGISIAKLMYGYLKYARKSDELPIDINYWHEHQSDWFTPEQKKIRPDRFVDELYTKASKDFKDDPKIENIVRQMVIDWEAGDKKNWALWEKVLDYSHKGQEMTLKRLGNRWDYVWHEHEHYKKGKEMVMQGLKKGTFKKGKGGAIITDLAKYNLPDTVLIKSDGTALYLTQDIALTALKQEKFNPDRIFWTIGPEQSLQMKQLFAVSEQLGIGKYDDFTHLAYGWMSIKGQGKMSSRSGNIVYIDKLIDMAKNKISQKMQNENFPADEKEKITEDIALGAVKYSSLKPNRMQSMEFDIEASVSIEGDSGPYIQYTYARAQSVLRKSNNHSPEEFMGSSLKSNAEESALLRYLSYFDEIIIDSALNYSPSTLCNYLYELAQIYNTFYNAHQIIGDDQQTFRLALTSATGHVLKNGLTLLGISAPEKM